MKFLDKICLFFFLTNVDSRLREQHRPCAFNPLCTCSNGGPDLGSVCCHNIPFMTVPSHINNSAIYIMSLKNNKLRFLEDNSLYGTGLWKLQINDNLLTDLKHNALAGLERTLSILDLSKNNLIRIPKESMQNLEKISNLNLAGNNINFLHNDDLRNIGKTLKQLDLSENALMHIQNDAFRYMMSLEVLNLGYNSIITIDDITFQGGLSNLKQIVLTGNQLEQIPLNLLANLKNIKIVNLNENLISTISEGRELRSRIYLDELHLEYNLIKELTAESFRLFSQINRFYLKGNPLTIVNDTFLMTNVTEIYMPHCSISKITRNAFYGAKHSLQVLDLSYNELTEFPPLSLTRLVKLSLTGNEISEIVPDDIKHYGNSLKYLDITGKKMNGISQESMMYLPSLREISFSKRRANINWDYLQNVGSSMEKLYITKSSIKTIENGAFQKLTGLKYLDLSYNIISKIENTTFKDVRHSLEKLTLHSALRMSIFPQSALNSVTKLEYLDVSSNGLMYLPPESFSSLQNLKYFNLNHNELRDLNLNFVNDVHNPNLRHLNIAFNKIGTIKSHAFRNLKNLVYLQLNDNLIQTVKKASFLDLDSIANIRLEGNLIETIENEAFQNLPNIQSINLAYNKLNSLNLEAFNQVGRLSTLRINVDHNNIQNLTSNITGTHTSSNIKSIEFSYNNISYLDGNYFDPIRLSVTILDLSHNQIYNLTSLAFAGMAHLQILRLSDNLISTVEENELQGVNSVQILELSNNLLEELPPKLFEETKKLRILFLAQNNLEKLPKGIFQNTVIEQIDLSQNNFYEFPEESIFQVNSTLQFLDLSSNHIKSINFGNIKALHNLRYLSLAKNKLFLPTTAAELQFPKLISLDVSYNPIKELPVWIANHLPMTLENLNLANTSLKSFPILNAGNILLLNLSSNIIESVETETLEHLKEIQTLDFSNNKLISTFNDALSNLQMLKSLYLQDNPIRKLLNASFNNMERLQELYIKNLELDEVHPGVFYQLPALKKLELDVYPSKISISDLLKKNNGVKELHIHVQGNEMNGIIGENIPKSLKSLILEGANLKYMEESTFSKLRSHDLMLDIRYSNITNLSQRLLLSMNKIRNITASFMNNKIQTMEREITEETEVPKKHLMQLKLSGNDLNCNCEFSWIWEWLKEYDRESGCEEQICDDSYMHDLRETKCVNWGNKSIISVFKSDLDCFSSNARSLYSVEYILILITAMGTFFINKLF